MAEGFLQPVELEQYAGKWCAILIERRLDMKTATIILLLVVAACLVSCSGMSAVSPDSEGPVPPGGMDRAVNESSRWVWGNWRMYIPAEHSRAEVAPIRVADFHYNVKMLLEQAPCDNCLWVSKFVNHGDGTISVDVSIRHPYPGNKYFTGFDVRAILYTTANYWIANPGETHYPPYVPIFLIPALEAGDPEVLNPDGCTSAFYPAKYSDYPPIFRFQYDNDLGGTLDKDDVGEWGWNELYPFICYYSSEVRRHFASNAVVTRTFHIALPPGEWEFNYSVDACWAPPTNVPVTDIEADFPVQANTLGYYRVDSFMSGPLVGDEPSTLTVRIYHHLPEILQYYDYLCLYTNCITGGLINVFNPVIVDDKYLEYTCEIANILHVPSGRYPIVITPSISAAGEDYLWDIEKKWGINSQLRQVLWVTVEN
jgi:hypothetical protein